MNGTAEATSQALFDRAGWWDPACRDFASLRAVTTFRLELLREWLPDCARGVVVDLGCGGGLLAVPLARSGARVVAVDLARHALAELRRQGIAAVHPVRSAITEVPLADGCADLVLLADVLEHVEPMLVAKVVAEAARLLRPGGHLFVNTIARTWKARLLAITLGEGLGLVPRGTHRADWFVPPQELDRCANTVGLLRVSRCGETVRPFATLRRRAIVLKKSRDFGVGYAVLYRRRDA